MKKSLLFFCFAVLMNGLFAQNRLWIGAPGANWSVATNWSPASVPGVGDTAVFNSNNNCNVDNNYTVAAIRATGAGLSNGLSNNTGLAKTITITSNPVSSPVVYVQAGSSFILANGPTSASVSLVTYGASGDNTALIDGTMFISISSTWNVSNVTHSTNVTVSSTGTIYVPGPHIGPNVFLNSTTANLKFLSGANFGWGRNGGSIPTADYQNGSIMTISGVSSTMPTFSNAANYNGLLIWNSGGQTVSGASAILLPSASYTMDSILVTTTGTGSLRMTTEPGGYTLGNLEVTGGKVEMGAPLLGLGTANILGDLNISGTGTVYGNINNIGEATENPVTININGNLIVSGGTLNLTNRPILGPGLFGACQVNVKGNVSQTGGGVVTATYVYGSQNQLVLNGTAAQNLTMTTFSGPMALAINNSSAAGVTLLSNLTIPAAPAALVFVSGVLTTTAANLLTMDVGSQVFGAANGSYVDGPVKKIGNTLFVFPVGKTIGVTKAYVPIEISATGGPATDNFTAEYKRSTAEIYPVTNVGIQHVSRVDYWTLDRAGTASIVNIKLYWTNTSSNGGSPNYINNLPELIIAFSNGAQWNNFGGMGTYGASTVAAGSLTWTNATTNTTAAYSLASTTINNPLPITVNYLNGIKQNGAHYLNWQVTCFNNDRATMVLERGADGRNFTAINTISADALRCQQPFDYTDINLLAGMNYYRLKMIDANGKITYSSIIALLNKESGFDIVSLSPNLITANAILNVTAAQKTKMDVVITDISGRQVQKIAYHLIAGSNQFTMNLSGLSAGTYQMKGYTADGVSRTIRFVKQ